MSKEAFKLPSLDGLRAISIGLVVLGHASATTAAPEWFKALARWAPDSEAGVTVFFVISGYLITTLLRKERTRTGAIDLKAFYIRRILRIFPVFYLYLAAVYLLDRAQGLEIHGWLYLAAATFTTNFVSGGTWLLGHTWSLAVEEQFYLSWPWVMRAGTRVATVGSIILILLGPVARIVGALRPDLAPYLLVPFLRHADAIMLGCAGALHEHRFGERLRRWLGGYTFLFIASLILVAVSYMRHTKGFGRLVIPFGTSVEAGLVVLVILGVTIPSQTLPFRILNWAPMARLGVLSYSLYLWQQPFLYSEAWIHSDVWWRRFPLCIALALVTAALSYSIWERPFLRLKDRLKAPRNGTVA